MRDGLLQLGNRLLGGHLDFRVRLFNVLAMAGIAVSFISAIVSFAMGEKLQNPVVYLIFGLLAAALLAYASKSGRYQRCYIITIVAIFLIGFPFFFFNNGGYYGTIPYFFIFALVFTAFMLEGKLAFIFLGTEMLLYLGICLYAYFFFEPAAFYLSSRNIMITCIFGFMVVGAALSAVMLLQFRLYNQQQKQLAEQNILLGQINRMKTELFGNISHELKTPLTVISVHTQRAQALLDLGRDGDMEKIRESHALAQEEVMRLSRLVDSALSLASIQDAGKQKAVLDLRNILRTTSEAYRSLLEKKENELFLSLPEYPLPVFGNADQMVQLISNLLNNAGGHTKRGEIHVQGVQSGQWVTMIISDNGEGIAPDFLPHVFERGMTKGGGSGLGLYICRQIASDHKGEVTIDSTQDAGTTVTITLPLHKEEDLHEKNQTAAD